MPGLLDALDDLLSGLPASVDVAGVAGELGAVVNAVESLTEGPDVLTNLRTAVQELPLPAGLEGIATLAGNLTALPALFELDASASLAPVLGPIQNLSTSIGVTAVGNFGALVDLLRAGIEIATGRRHGGPQGMPDAADLPQQQKPSLEEIRVAITDARAQLAAIGPFDAATSLERLLRASAGFRTPLVRFMPIPIVDDLLQPLATVESWRGQTGTQLAESLGDTLGLLAQVLDLPTTRVARPILDAAALLASAGDALSPLVERLRAEDRNEADLANATRTLNALANVLQVDTGPFQGLRELPNDLIHARLMAVRAVEPPLSLGPAMAKLRELIGLIPAVGADPLGPVVQGLRDFDLSALTDALGSVRAAVDDAVSAANDGRDAVRDGLTGLLQSIDDALAAASGALDLPAITGALGTVPGELGGFVDTQIVPVVTPLRDAIVAAVSEIARVTTEFDPARLLEPIRDALEQAAALINDPAVASAFAEVDRVLGQVLSAVEQFDLAGAADQAIGLMNDIRDTMRQIDPGNIPDAIKPPLRDAVDFLTGIDFHGTIAVPIEQVGQQVASGAGVALREIEQGLEEVRIRVEAFRPSELIQGDLAAPFVELRTRLQGFQPSQLLAQLQQELDGLAARAHVLDASTMLAPLRSAHGDIVTALAQAQPSALLEPVNNAIQQAVADVLAVSRLDQVLDGIQDIVAEINTYVDLANDLRGVLTDVAALFSSPGDGEAAVRAFVETALDRLDPLDMASLAAPFAAVAAANRRNQRDVLAATLSAAMRSADRAASALASAPVVHALSAAIAALPPESDGLAGLQAAQQRFDEALASWARLRDDIDDVAGNLFERLLDYQQAEIIEGGSVLDPLTAAPATVAALKAAIRPALEDTVREPLLVLNAILAAVSPYLAGMAAGMEALVAAAHQKVSAIAGDAGLGGITEGLDALVQQLRDFDLTPISDPLDAVFEHIEAAVGALSPEPLEAAIAGANQALEGVLSLARLIPETTVRSLDGQYQGAVQRLLQLNPTTLLSEELDPLYEDLMGAVLPLFELPSRLRAITDAAAAQLSGGLSGELGRIEEAFDEMLRSIPLQDAGGPSASASASVSIA